MSKLKWIFIVVASGIVILMLSGTKVQATCTDPFWCDLCNAGDWERCGGGGVGGSVGGPPGGQDERESCRDRHPQNPDACSTTPEGCTHSSDDNLTCSAMKTYLQTTEPSHPYAFNNHGSFFKIEDQTPDNPPPPVGQVENNFYNDQITFIPHVLWYPNVPDLFDKPLIGFRRGLMDFPDNNFENNFIFSCSDQHRSFGFMYLPTGWHDIAVAGNRYTGSNACNHCLNPSDYACREDGESGDTRFTVRICWWDENAQGDLIRRCRTPSVSCNDFDSWVLNTDPPTVGRWDLYCKIDCGGFAGLWMARNGSGTQADPYRSQAEGESSSGYVLEDRFTGTYAWTRAAVYENPNASQDIFWSGPQYYNAGYYPVQTSIYSYVDEYLGRPAVYWRPCSNSNPNSCQSPALYEDAGGYGASIASCYPESTSPTQSYCEVKVKEGGVGTDSDYRNYTPFGDGDANTIEPEDSPFSLAIEGGSGSGTTIDVKIRGAARNILPGSNPVRLLLARRTPGDPAYINPTPPFTDLTANAATQSGVGNISPLSVGPSMQIASLGDQWTPITVDDNWYKEGSEHRFYVLGECTSTDGNECSDVFTVQLPDEVGEYWLQCSAGSWPYLCGGNPLVDRNGTPPENMGTDQLDDPVYPTPPPLPNRYSCGGPEYRYGVDNAAFSVGGASYSISGTVYLDYNSDCGPGDPPYMTNNPSVSLISGPSVNIVEGSYTFTVYNGTYGVNLTVPNGYDLSVCPPLPLPLPPVDNSNPRTVQVNSVNISGIDFYLTPEGTNSWWQTRGGDVGANSDNNIGTAVSSNLPPNTLLSLASTISLPFPFDMDQGVLLYQMTSVNPLNFGSGFWVDTMNPDKWIAQSAYELGDNNLKREDFSLFRELFNLPDPTDDGTGSSAWDAPNNDNSKFDLPETHPGDTDTSAIATIPNTFVYQGDLTLADWGDPDVAVDGTYIVLVNGDLTLAADFTVQEGGFAMFIVSGDITINPAVTKAEGIYVADGVLELETAGASSDALLNGAGTFVGWGGVEFWRNIGDPNNPSSVMTYRPDFLLNAPNDLRLPVFSWSQVNPLKVDTGAYAPWPPTPTP